MHFDYTFLIIFVVQYIVQKKLYIFCMCLRKREIKQEKKIDLLKLRYYNLHFVFYI